MRLIIGYSRGGAAKYVSHLDMQRLFMRAFKRSKLNVEYSKGFNPHIIMSFASPLSVGYGTLSDYLEVAIQPDTYTGDAVSALNAVLPPDVRVNRAFFVNDRAPKLMSMNHSAGYELRPVFNKPDTYDRIEEELAEIISGSPRVVTDRKGRQTDISPLVPDARFDGGKIVCTLANNNRSSLNPSLLLAALSQAAGEEIKAEICRTECYADTGAGVMPFYKIGDIFK